MESDDDIEPNLHQSGVVPATKIDVDENANVIRTFTGPDQVQYIQISGRFDSHESAQEKLFDILKISSKAGTQSREHEASEGHKTTSEACLAGQTGVDETEATRVSVEDLPIDLSCPQFPVDADLMLEPGDVALTVSSFEEVEIETPKRKPKRRQVLQMHRFRSMSESSDDVFMTESAEHSAGSKSDESSAKKKSEKLTWPAYKRTQANERERLRTKKINKGLENLQAAVPSLKIRKNTVSRLEILRGGISYIKHLEGVLGMREDCDCTLCGGEKENKEIKKDTKSIPQSTKSSDELGDTSVVHEVDRASTPDAIDTLLADDRFHPGQESPPESLDPLHTGQEGPLESLDPPHTVQEGPLESLDPPHTMQDPPEVPPASPKKHLFMKLVPTHMLPPGYILPSLDVNKEAVDEESTEITIQEEEGVMKISVMDK